MAERLAHLASLAPASSLLVNDPVLPLCRADAAVPSSGSPSLYNEESVMGRSPAFKQSEGRVTATSVEFYYVEAHVARDRPIIAPNFPAPSHVSHRPASETWAQQPKKRFCCFKVGHVRSSCTWHRSVPSWIMTVAGSKPCSWYEVGVPPGVAATVSAIT